MGATRYSGSVAVEHYVKFIAYKGCPILQIDFEGCQPPELLERIRYARSVIAGQPLDSVRTLTLVKNARFNNQVSGAMKAYTAHNKPYVRIAAVVGLSGLQDIVYNVIVKVTGRKIATFPYVEEAKNFLADYSE
jgi:hypothetical protein